MVKQWFRNLEKREQWMLMAAAVAIVFYLAYGVLFRGLVDARDKYQRMNAGQRENLEWVRATAPMVQALRSSNARPDIAAKPLAQLAEEAAGQANVRISRFQPVDDSEAQVWLEQEDFGNVLAFLNVVESDYGLLLKDVSITTANSPGVVNLRLKFAK